MDNQYFSGSQDASFRLDELDARLVRRDDVIGLIQVGQKIKAIKVYREDTGASLLDARAAIERMAMGLNGMNMVPSSSQAEAYQAGAYVMGSSVDMEALRFEVERLVIQGQQINAIKLYRERTGTGLREAKEAVDQIHNDLRTSGFSAARPPSDWRETEPRRDVPGEEVRRYLLAGKKIQAIKAYREQTNLSLKDAKDEIDRLEQELRFGLR